MTVTSPLLPALPGTPPCGPPLLRPEGCTLTRYADVRAALAEPACQVPVAEPGPPGTLAWLRGTVSRFSDSARHPSRRAAGVAALAAVDPAALRAEAARLTAAAVDRSGGVLDVPTVLARRVPVALLAARLGFADPDAAVPAVTAVAAAYQPGADPQAVRRADRAVAELVAMAPPEPGATPSPGPVATPSPEPVPTSSPGPSEALANRIGLLVQACDATAGLIGAGTRHLLPPPTAPSSAADAPLSGAPSGAAPPSDAPLTEAPPGGDSADLLAEVLRLDPPVRGTRRVAATAVRIGGLDLPPGTALLLRFDAANRDPAVFAEPDVFRPGRAEPALTFGAGLRGCPGRRHALALAAGVLDVLRARCRRSPEPVRYEPHPLLRVPSRLVVTAR